MCKRLDLPQSAKKTIWEHTSINFLDNGGDEVREGDSFLWFDLQCDKYI